MKPPVVGAVIVTRNRLALLKEAVDALRAQTRKPDFILLINNDSNDGTREWLDAQSDLRVIHQANVGGSGGFNRGIREAYAAGAEWVWCMDDDSICAPDALEKLLRPSLLSRADVGLLSNRVHWKDGTLHVMNLQKATGTWSWLDRYDSDRAIEISSCSFVGMMISRSAIETCGLPIAEMFIWLDDCEYSERICKRFRGFIVTDSVILHKTPGNTGFDPKNIDPASVWKYAYFCRNQFLVLRLHHGGLGYFVRAFRLAVSTVVKVGRLSLSSSSKFGLFGKVMNGMLFFRPKVEYPNSK